MSPSIGTEIEIAAPPERVWTVLTDFAAYPEWNPFVRRLAGVAEVGARLDAFLQPPGGRGMRIRPRVLAVVPNREFRWLGHLGVPGLFDGEHIFRIEPLGPERVRFVQEERFRGILVPLLLRFIADGTRQGFTAMNEALAARTEGAG